MWHGRIRPELNTCSSIDYKHSRSTVESVGPPYSQQSHIQRPSDSYSGDLRDALTGFLTKESHHGETKGPVEVRRYDYRHSSSGSSYLNDIRNTISKSTRAEELNTYGESQSGPFNRDLRNMISNANMRVSGTGSNEVETTHSREYANSYYSRILDSSGHQIRELSNMSYPGNNSGLDQFARSSQETINSKDLSFLTTAFKACGDPKIVFGTSENRLLMSMNQNPSHGNISSVRSQDITNLTHSHLLASSGLGVNLQTNLYPGKELMMINSLQNPIVVSTPLQIMEAAAVAAANKTAGSSTGGAFWNSLKKEGLISYQKPHGKSLTEELDVTDVVGEDFQMPDLTVKRFSKVKRSRSRSPVRQARVSSKRSPVKQRTASLNRQSASSKQKYDILLEKESKCLQKDKSSRKPRIKSHNVSKDERIRSRSPERMPGHRRWSREITPGRMRERSPRGARSRSPCWDSKNVSRFSRDLSPHQIRESSPRHYRDISPQMPREIASHRYRDQSPRQYHDISPPRVRETSRFQRSRSREFSPRRFRAFSPPRARKFSPPRSRELSPRRSREFSPRRSREFSPRRSREFSPRRSREFSPRRSGEFSPRRSGEFSPRRSREFSPRRSREFSPRRLRDLSPRRSRDLSPRRSREFSPRMQRERPHMVRGISPGIMSSRHSRESDRYPSQRVRDSPLGDLKLSHENSPRTGRRHSREMSPGRLTFRKAHSRSPILDRERSSEHFRGSSPDRVRRYPMERDRGYSPVPVIVLSPERLSLKQRGCSPVSLQSLSPESVRRYPQESQGRSFAEYHERSSSRVMHSAEEDVESPRRSWDLRLKPKRKRKRGVKKSRNYTNNLDTRQQYHRGSSIDLPGVQVEKMTQPDQDKQTPALSHSRKASLTGQHEEVASIDMAREVSPISMTSNDDKEFGLRSQSPVFDEVSLSPRSTRASSPGTPTSDEKPKPLSNCYDLPKGSPVSVADLSEEKGGNEDRKSVDLNRNFSPVSLEEHTFDDPKPSHARAGSPISDEENLIVTDSVDAQDSATEADGDKEGEDLRVQILRLREEKVERRLKKLDEESKETELRLQNLSPELLDYSPMRDTPSPLLDECEDERRPEQGNRKFYGY